jgi:uncharacterized membrane protein
MKIVEQIIEAVFFLKVFISPVLIGIVISFFIVMGLDSSVGNIIAMMVMLLSLYIGYIWASKAKKKYGSSNYYSKLNTSETIDKSNF